MVALGDPETRGDVGGRAHRWAVVLAGGAGSRFGALKQFAPLGGKRCVDLALDAARTWCDGAVVVVPSDTPHAGYGFDIPRNGFRATDVVVSGSSRCDSVRNGLAAVPLDVEVIVVHDAVHPLAPAELFRDVIAAVEQGADAAVPVLAATEAVKRVDPGGRVTATVPRAGLGLAQMPQAFRADVLRALHAEGRLDVEDSELVERSGGKVTAVPGHPWNIHITTQEELALAWLLVDSHYRMDRAARLLEAGAPR